MPALLLYLVKFSCSLGILWLFYRLVLRSLTFYNWNRWYLMGYSILCFLIPFINIGPIRGEDPALQPVIIQYIPVIGEPAHPALPTAAGPAAMNPWNYLLLVLALGSSFLLIRFAVRWCSLYAIRRKALLIGDGPIRIFHVGHPIAPFSFGNAIFINPDQHSQNQWEEIILHEYVHIRQRHTLDILFGELLVIVNWYNPFAWLIRHSIRQNLEFIADRAVLETGRDKKDYQYHLLKVVGENRYRIANNFNFSSLKKRIIMMNKMKSTRLHLLRFLFILPLLATLLVAFRDRLPAFHSRKDLFVNAAGIVINTPSRKPVANATVKELNSGVQTTTDSRGYYKLRIPINSDSVRVSIQYSKIGYDGTITDKNWTSVKESKGMCDIGFVHLQSDTGNGIYSLRPMEEPPVDPSYADAVRRLKTVQVVDIVAQVRESMQKTHPEISLWYIGPHAQQWILVHMDGTVERYGYPGTPPVTDIGGKYGAEFFIMAGNLPPVSSNYLSRWAAISAQAEKEFHTATPGIRSIIFPGDSRVIVVPISGNPRVFDMNSANPKERPAFERLYGKLPDCVPAPSRNAPPPTIVPAPVDTVPHGRDTLKQTPIAMAAAPLKDIPIDKDKALWVVDGVTKPAGWDWRDSLKGVSIASEDLLTGEQAIRIFGKAGTNGVLAILTASGQNPLFQFSRLSRDLHPLYIIDGRIASRDVLATLDPNAILSINVLKPEAAKAIYGEKGRDGVILIILKNIPK